MRVDTKIRFDIEIKFDIEINMLERKINRFESYFVILDCNVVLIYILRIFSV